MRTIKVIGVCSILLILIVLCYMRTNRAEGLQKGTIPYNVDHITISSTSKSNNNDLALVGYDNKLIYTSQSTQDAVEYYINDGNTSDLFYRSKASAIFFNQLYNRDILIGEFYADDSMSFRVLRINADIEEILIQGECKGIPIVNVIGENLVINSHINKEGKVEQTLQLYNLENHEIKTIGNYVYEIDEAGNCTGELLQAVDGFDNNIVFEVICFENENMDLDETGKPILFRYNFLTEDLIKLPINLSRKLLYVAGDEQCIVTSDYAYARPLDDVGTIYVLKNGKYVSMKIPEIESGNDIVDAERVTESIILLQTLENVYIIDYENKIYEMIDNYNPMKVKEQSFGFINENNVLNIYNFAE